MAWRKCAVKMPSETTLVYLLMAGLLFCASACSKNQASSEPQAIAPLDRVNNAPVAPPARFHKSFALKGYEKFEFTVPPHTLNPHLRGTLESWANGDSEQVDLLILNEQEFADFTQGKPGSFTYKTTPAPDEMVDYSIPSTQQYAKKYYLVCSNPSRGAKSVQADLTITFQ
jgi:hypothetical protein